MEMKDMAKTGRVRESGWVATSSPARREPICAVVAGLCAFALLGRPKCALKGREILQDPKHH